MEVLANNPHEWFNMECPVCGKMFHLKKSKIQSAKRHYCSVSCHSIAKQTYCKGEGNHQYGLKGENNPTWKGGRKLSQYGYWEVQCIGHPFAVGRVGYILEHRLIAEKYLLTDENSVVIDSKRYLSPDYIVHHKNGDRLDNRPENLMVMRKGEHSRLHNTVNDKNRHRTPDGRYASEPTD